MDVDNNNALLVDLEGLNVRNFIIEDRCNDDDDDTYEKDDDIVDDDVENDLLKETDSIIYVCKNNIKIIDHIKSLTVSYSKKQ